MNSPVIVVALVLACTFSSYAMSPEFKAAIDECKTEHSIESGQIKEAVEHKKLPETENGRCFMSCVMEKMGVIKDGKIDQERVLEINKMKFKNPESLEKANEVAKRCANVEGTDERCSLATEMVKCAMENALELKLEMPEE
ncbi:general odorant-binding protein 56h [Halyomorpha halys]|uniref:Odorant-binding protein 6 n=1 Tax=Halyomorpha halys TaxID=286706 RepID=A0A1L2JGT2_HALHY|nr:general odorant-binding protein 56h-like [Halyomorpha halys]AOV87023.1 odorant-binding protein 6 [Halyomorpha halys]KAE8573009.1 Odorant-binding protein 6 [Halyomorpha halys]